MDLAKILGLAQTTIANYEQNIRFPNETNLMRIADFFDVSLDYLLGRRNVLINTNSSYSNSADNTIYGDQLICLSSIAAHYLQALLSKNKTLAIKIILTAFQQGVPVSDLYMKVLEPTLKEIGRLWECNQIYVAQEHYFSEITQLIISKLYLDTMPTYSKNSKVVTMAVNGEYHHIGIKIVTNLLELDGWKSFYLGVNIPSESLIKTIEEEKADVLVISATMSFNINSVDTLINTIRLTKSCKNIKIMVGGNAFNTDESLWKAVGADAYSANGVDAVKVANDLVK